MDTLNVFMWIVQALDLLFKTLVGLIGVLLLWDFLTKK